MTNEERILIAKLNTGELDGVVGDLLRTSGGSTVWTSIKGECQFDLSRGRVGSSLAERKMKDLRAFFT